MPKQPPQKNEDPAEGSREVVERQLEQDNKRNTDRSPGRQRGDPRSLQKDEEGGGPA